MNPFGGFDLMFNVFSIIFFVMFALVLGIFIYVISKNISRERKNNHSPRLTTEATVVTKRTHVWGDHSHTNYYVTFELPSGDRMELKMTGREYGLLAEGDTGMLSFQGTRYLGFERNI